MAGEVDPTCNPVNFVTQDGCKPSTIYGTVRDHNEREDGNTIFQEPVTKNLASEPDYSGFDIVKATQYGALERCKEIIEEGYDVNKPDNETVTLLHWASINNRKEIIKYYVSKGAVVDAVGGELMSTPLHWATRQGHLGSVVLLMQCGADPSLRDGEGASCIHLAAQFGHTAVVAYLVAKGVSVDMRDRNGMTPLMWSAYKVTSLDPTRLLLTFGACTAAQDKLQGNTALHWAVIARNHTAVSTLVMRGASMDIPNSEGETVYNMLSSQKATWVGKKVNEKIQEISGRRRNICYRLTRDKHLRFWCMVSTPFMAFYVVGVTLESSLNYLVKMGVFVLAYIVLHFGGQYLYDERLMNLLPMSIYLATKPEIRSVLNVHSHLISDNLHLCYPIRWHRLKHLISGIITKFQTENYAICNLCTAKISRGKESHTISAMWKYLKAKHLSKFQELNGTSSSSPLRTPALPLSPLIVRVDSPFDGIDDPDDPAVGGSPASISTISSPGSAASSYGELSPFKKPPGKLKALSPNQPTMKAFLDKMQSFKPGDKRTKTITKLVAEMICKDNQPLPIVEHKGFKKLINHLEPRCIIPSRKHIAQKVIPEMYKEEKIKVEELLKILSLLESQLICGHQHLLTTTSV